MYHHSLYFRLIWSIMQLVNNIVSTSTSYYLNFDFIEGQNIHINISHSHMISKTTIAIATNNY